VPLLRRIVADPDQDVRHAGVDAIEDVAAKDKDEAVKLYKLLVDDADPVVRSKASGQLSRLVPPLPRIAVASPTPTPTQTPGLPPPDDKLAAVKRARDEAEAAAGQAQDAYQRFVKTGTGPRAQIANDRLSALADEIQRLAQ